MSLDITLCSFEWQTGSALPIGRPFTSDKDRFHTAWKTSSFVRRSFPRKSEKNSSYNPKKMWSTEQDEWKGWLCALAHENLPAGKATKRHHGNNVILAAVLPVVTLLVVLLDNVYLCIYVILIKFNKSKENSNNNLMHRWDELVYKLYPISS